MRGTFLALGWAAASAKDWAHGRVREGEVVIEVNESV